MQFESSRAIMVYELLYRDLNKHGERLPEFLGLFVFSVV